MHQTVHFHYRLAAIGLACRSPPLESEVLRGRRSRPMPKYNFISPLKACEYQFADPEKEKVRNIYSLALLLQQNPIRMQSDNNHRWQTKRLILHIMHRVYVLEDSGGADDAYFHLAQ
ncbi:hypothetical protein Tco_0767393 [Tanacetum coccineum]